MIRPNVTKLRVVGSDKPELSEVRVGYIPLTDCASVVLAAQLGFDQKHGIKIVPQRQASWSALRDRLLGESLHAAHMLYGLAYGIECGIGGPRREMAVLMTLNQNGQGITCGHHLQAVGVTDGSALARYIATQALPPTFAHTFPTGTHALWLNYWLAAHGIDPLTDVHTRTVPPPQMVQRLASYEIDGYSAGEPWNALAVERGVGYTIATSQAIWPDHPDKVLGTTRAFVQTYPHTARALIMALLEASRFIETVAEPFDVARRLAAPDCIDTKPEIIAARLCGDYHDGLGATWRDAHPLRFFADGAVNYPYLSDAMWFMAQHRRWGLLEATPDYLRIASAVNQTALYQEAAQSVGIALPSSPFRSSRLMDGVLWTGESPDALAIESSFSQSARVIAHE